MTTNNKRAIVDTSAWVQKKMPKQDDLATVAFLMDQFTRDENSAYADTVFEQSLMLTEDNMIISRQAEIMREQAIAMETMRVSMASMASIIHENEEALRALQPGREFGYAIGIDRRNIQHAVVVQYPEAIEFPIEQEIIDLITEEELGSDTESETV